MSFQDTSFSREHRYSLGIDTESGRYYLSIPVSNRLFDYEEYHEISATDHDELLIQRPGWNRGTPV